MNAEKTKKSLKTAFRADILTLPLSSILPQKITDPKILRSTVFKQILSSIREVGLIESLVVYPEDGKGFLLLDGHLRLEALRVLGIHEANCILSTDDESYTYNKRVNHIPPIAQHFMLLEALKSGLTAERIAATLNINVSAIRNRVQMLDGICPEVVEMLRNQKLSMDVFTILRKMKPIGQIATAELMMLRNDYSSSFAKTRLAISPPSLLCKPESAKQSKAKAEAADALLSEDTESLIQSLRAIEQTYGMDILTLTVSCAYFERLMSDQAVVRYLNQHHPGPMETLRTVINDIRSKTASENAAYLHKGLRTLRANCDVRAVSLFVFGHSFADNDAHILDQIRKGKCRDLFVSIYGDPETDVNRQIMIRAHQLASLRSERYPLSVKFFRAQSANIWGTA